MNLLQRKYLLVNQKTIIAFGFLTEKLQNKWKVFGVSNNKCTPTLS